MLLVTSANNAINNNNTNSFSNCYNNNSAVNFQWRNPANKTK